MEGFDDGGTLGFVVLDILTPSAWGWFREPKCSGYLAIVDGSEGQKYFRHRIRCFDCAPPCVWSPLKMPVSISHRRLRP